MSGYLEVVLALWSDLTKRHGFGALIVKGEDLMNASKDGAHVEATVDAFMCKDLEHAVGAKQLLAGAPSEMAEG